MQWRPLQKGRGWVRHIVVQDGGIGAGQGAVMRQQTVGARGRHGHVHLRLVATASSRGGHGSHLASKFAHGHLVCKKQQFSFVSDT